MSEFNDTLGMHIPKRGEQARNNAQRHFSNTEKRDALVKDELAKERAATDAKTTRLRALRMAKEAADAEAAALAPPAPKKKRARAAAKK